MDEEQGKKIVQIIKANVIALDPAKKYLIVVDRAAATKEDVAEILDWFHDQGIEATTGLRTDGDAFTSVQVIEVG